MAKAEVIDVAARASFETYKVSVDDMYGWEWDALPDSDGHSPPGPRCKDYWRRDVATPVEALWRQGLIVGS